MNEKNSLVNGYVTITKNKGRKDEVIIQEDIKNLLTTSGRDFFHAQDYTNTGVGTKGSNAIALSFDPTDPAAGDTTLAGEITTGGLTRVQAGTISHSVGTNVTTLQNLFIATAVFTNLHKSALFNQDTIGGQMTHASDFVSDVTLAIGDGAITPSSGIHREEFDEPKLYKLVLRILTANTNLKLRTL